MNKNSLKKIVRNTFNHSNCEEAVRSLPECGIGYRVSGQYLKLREREMSLANEVQHVKAVADKVRDELIEEIFDDWSLEEIEKAFSFIPEKAQGYKF